MFNVVSQIYLCRERMARDWSRVKPKLYTDTSPFLRGCAWNESTIRLIIRFILQNPSHIYCTKMYPMALRCLFPLSGLLTASLPHVFESSGCPFVPNPILESHEPHSFLFSLTIPILALEYLLQLQTTLNPSLLQLACNEPWEPINSFHLSRPSEVARYWPSAISECRESACLWMTMNLSCWLIFIPRQILEKDVFQ